MDFGLLRNGLRLGARNSGAGRTYLFQVVFQKSAFDEICKETEGQMDFGLLGNRLRLAPGGLMILQVVFEKTCSMKFAKRPGSSGTVPFWQPESALSRGSLFFYVFYFLTRSMKFAKRP